jgi:uncharacterized membrane protein/predicted DsbA family dithiol-disulfide isomerase
VNGDLVGTGTTGRGIEQGGTFLSTRAREREPSGGAPGVESPARLPARPLWLALALALAGLAVALWLAQLQVEAHSGVRHGCTIEGTSFDCDRVATSEYSVVLGLPVAVWGVFGYGLAGLLAGWGLARRRSRTTWPLGLLWVVASLAVLVSVALALVSELLIGAWCLYCMTSWAVSVALLAATWVAARRAGGVACVVGADLSTVRAHPFWALVTAVAATVVVGVAAGGYDRYAQPPPPQPAAARVPAGARTPVGTSGGGEPGALTVIEYSDYLCPACLHAHERNRLLFGNRTDVTLERRQFPLDSACNPLVTQTIHPGACQLARAAICAEAQGRFDAMDDALFQNQRDRLPLDELARRAGLDLGRFNQCLGSPQTARRLAEEIDVAVRSGVNATPSYLVGGRLFSGELPQGVVPPRR